MLRTAVGLSFLVLFGALSACSSKSTDNGSGAAGNGAVLGGTSSGGSPGSGGVANNGTAGTSTNTAGTSANTAGTSASVAGTGGGSGLCATDAVTCLDATTAKTCDPATGLDDTFSCVDDAATYGFVSSGCMADAAAGDHCVIESVLDPACDAGAAAVTYCGNGTTSDHVSFYIDCFQDFEGRHEIVTCFSKYVTPTMKTSDDCNTAADACIPGGVGAGGDGAGGAGGTP